MQLLPSKSYATSVTASQFIPFRDYVANVTDKHNCLRYDTRKVKKKEIKMEAIQEQTTSRLLKKLSALRSTLRKDERDLLDAMVLRSAEDVSAHVLNTAKAIGAKATAKATGADEVAAHGLATAKATGAKQTAKATDADEVAAHGLATVKATGVKATGADEVAAHGLATAKATGAKQTAKATGADEVAAHAMINSEDEAKAFIKSTRVVFDEVKQTYRIIT
jgi:hypothetical protein